MNIGNGEVIEVQHPNPTENSDAISFGQNRLHLGPIGSGKDIIRSETDRIEFARAHGLLATDIEMSSVLDSIIGNCRDSFILVKGKLQCNCCLMSIFVLIPISSFRRYCRLQRWSHK